MTTKSSSARHSFRAEAPDALSRPVQFRVYAIPAGTDIEPHRHGWCQFLFARTGTMQVETASCSLIVPPAFGVWVPAGVDHSLRAIEDVELESLYVEAEQLAPSVRHTARVVLVDPLVRDFIHHACCEIGSHYDAEGKEGRRVRVLIDMLEDLPNAAMDLPLPQDERLAALCRGLQAEPGSSDGIEQWAEQLGVSARALARQFQTETGLAFAAWRKRMRLMTSVILLRQGLGVAEVAQAVGCSSHSEFAYGFRETFGVSPSRFEAGR